MPHADPRPHLAEINTWRLYNKAVTQQGVVNMVEAWEANGYRFGTVCIDDGWTDGGRLGDWTPDPVRFPDLAGLANWVHGKGYLLRLWVAPAQMHADTRIYKQAFPHATLLNKAGKPALYPGLRTYRVDIRNPIGRDHVRNTMARLVRDYSIDAFKVDFPPFYEPHDDLYTFFGFDLPEHDVQTMTPNFYKLVREGIDSVNPKVRVECAKHLSRCQPFVNDTICGDLVGEDRGAERLYRIAGELREYAKGHDIVPWFEMVWGAGSDRPTPKVEWHAGTIEFIAISINCELKLELSFPPFDYPNAAQIRALVNLYGPRQTNYKVLHAGRQTFPVGPMQTAGLEVGPKTRFLVAPEVDTGLELHTGALGTNAVQWRGRDVFTGQPLVLRARNEYWGDNPIYCQVAFEVKAGHVYELWHEGEPEAYFRDLFAAHRP